MSHSGNLGISSSRPRLPLRKSLVELITKKTIDQISDLNFVAAHFASIDEGVDEFRYPETSFFAFPQPINVPHSTVRTIRLTMPAAKDTSGEDRVSELYNIPLPKFWRLRWKAES